MNPARAAVTAAGEKPKTWAEMIRDYAPFTSGSRHQLTLLFNLAQAYRLQGNCDDAALMYRRYLATNPGVEQRTRTLPA